MNSEKSNDESNVIYIFNITSFIKTLKITLYLYNTCFFLIFQRNESEVEGMAVGAGASSSFIGDDSVASDSPIATNPDDDGHKEGGKKKKNRCLSCKKKVGLTGKLID